MWAEITRAKSVRDGGRHASDSREAEWRPIAPDMPARKPPGRRRSTDLREAVDAILDLLRAGCPWRMSPKEFPPWRAVSRYFSAWRDSGLWAPIGHRLMLEARKAEGRRTGPSASIVGSQSVKTTESGGPRGFDAGKKVKGRKRHILTDTGGLPVTAQDRAADIQDRDGAPERLASGRAGFPWLRCVFADGAYAGPKLQTALDGKGRWSIEVVKRSETMRGFKPLPRRWVVERTLAWLSRPRRPDKDFEATIATAQAWLFIGNGQLPIRRIARA